MSFFDDQMDDWAENGFVGDPSDYYCGEPGPWVDEERARLIRKGASASVKPKTPAQRERNRVRRQKHRARKRAKAQAERGGQ